ncbi:MAG: hypothetical protein HY273_16175 [Gammaproteobacteria bacterium]|nr:hypothetical protein [Gammaproteobacteria bacterium]
MNSQDHQQALSKAILKLLRPLVRLLLRNGVPFAGLAEMAKQVYVDVARSEFNMPGRKQSTSRVSTITGVPRKEVQRIIQLEGNFDNDFIERHHRAARVVAGWVRDPDFLDAAGQPRLLLFSGQQTSFSDLVRKFSGDVPPRAILDELMHTGVVEQQDDGYLRLLSRSYVPKTGEAEKLGILGKDVAGLISTIDHNIQSAGKDPFFQRKVYYNNLPEEAVVELRRLLAEQGQQFIEKFDRWMAAHDRDSNPKVTGTGRKASGIGLYYFEDESIKEPPHEHDV